MAVGVFSHSSSEADRGNSNGGKINIGPYCAKFSKLKPVKAVQMLLTHSDRSIFDACEQLEDRGLPINVDSLLDVLNKTSSTSYSVEGASQNRSDDDSQTFVMQHTEGSSESKTHTSNTAALGTRSEAGAKKVEVLDVTRGPTTSNEDDRIKCHSETKNPKFVDSQQSKCAVASYNVDDDRLLSEDQEQKLSEARKIKEENARLREARLCCKCKEHQADIILLPCRHVSICHSCWNPLVKIPCPKCNMGVAGTFHVFWG